MVSKLQISPKQKEVLRFFANPNKQFLHTVGAVRSGKSWSLDLGWLMWSQGAFKEPLDFIMAGATVSSLRRNIFPDMMTMAENLGLGWKEQITFNYVQCGLHKYHIFGGSDKDAVDKVRGMTSAGVLLDESTLMDEDFINMCITRMSVPGAKMVASMNPSYPMHPYKTRFLDEPGDDTQVLEFGLMDNPSLTDQYKEMLKANLHGIEYQRLVEGKWVANAGLVYPNVEYYTQVPPAKNRKTTLAIDYSTSGTVACLLIHKVGQISYVDAELYHTAKDSSGTKTKQLSDEQLLDKIEKFLREHGLSGKSATFLPDPSAVSFKRAALQRGFKLRSCKNDVVEGIRVTNSALTTKHVLVNKKLKHINKELSNYQWDEKRCEKGDDYPIKTDAFHGVDALRYYSWREYAYLRAFKGPIAKPRGW